MCTKSQLEAIEEEMVNYYRSVYGDSIDTIILYGSYARGDYSDDSDITKKAVMWLFWILRNEREFFWISWNSVSES